MSEEEKDEMYAELSDGSQVFVVGTDDFSDLEMRVIKEGSDMYYFYNKKTSSLIKSFLLERKARVSYYCEVTLIKKGTKFNPRLTLCVRDPQKKIIKVTKTKIDDISSRVEIDSCHENFWKLIRYIESAKDIEIPEGSFSLMSQTDADVISALKGRDTKSIIDIIKGLSTKKGLALTKKDIDQLLKRKEKLEAFERALKSKLEDESKWQTFFEKNKWIFGYGLNYQILKQEQSQPHYGGTDVTGTGGQKGDFLTSTVGDINFTVLVEIKTPITKLLQGKTAIRNGAWSLSKDLIDAVSQIEANMSTWEKDSASAKNMDILEKEDVYTVQPKGIIVIGSLDELDTRDKRETFQRFRKSLHGVDIITFDELYNRAKFIVDSEA